MNKKFKKSLYLSAATLGILGISAGIIVPIALTSRYNPIPFDLLNPSDLNISNGQGSIGEKDIDEEAKERGYEDPTILNNIKNKSSIFLYSKEQKASLELQKLFFKKTIIKDVEKINEYWIESNTDERKTEKIKNVLETINKTIEKLETLEKVIEEGNETEDSKEFYSDTSFNSDYPKVLQIESKIRERQKKVFEDAKKSFIESKKFPTEKEGQDAWFNERKSKYGGALSDDEGIDYLVNRQISDKAHSEFKFIIVDEYTVEDFAMKNLDVSNFKENLLDSLTYDKTKEESPAKQFIENQFDYSITEKGKRSSEVDFLFKFLNNATSKNYLSEDSRKDNKEDEIFFFGTKSKQINKINILYSEGDTTIADNPLTKKLIANTNLIETSHALIKVKPNKKGSSLPWTTDKETIEKLYKGWNYGDSIFVPYEKLENLFTENHEKETDIFIRKGSGNSEGTINKSGSLGAKPANKFIETMVGGFGTGIALAYNNSKTEVATKDNLKLLKTELAKEENSNGFFGDLSSLDVSKRNKKIKESLEDSTEENINKIFGGIFKTIFDPEGTGTDLVYKAKGDSDTLERSILISEEHGVHITNINKIENAAELDALLKENMEKIAKDQNKSAAKIEFDTFFSDYYDELNRIDFLLNNKKSTETESEFYKYYVNNAYQNNQEKAKQDIKEINNSIFNKDFNKVNEETNKAVESKYSWYTKALIDETRKIRQLDPFKMYNTFYELANKKEEQE